MSSKHTPGPWALESVDTSVGSCHKIGPFPSAGVRSEVHACVYADRLRLGLDDGNPIAAELFANARLMAAAPDYHEAVQAIFDACEGNAAPVNLMAALRELDQQGKRISLDADLLIALFEAHAKATGGAQ